MPPRAEAAGVVKTIRLSPDEGRTVREALELAGQNFSDFSRDAILTRADEFLDRGRSREGRLAVLTPSGVVHQ